jgi:hypothetical protein
MRMTAVAALMASAALLAAAPAFAHEGGHKGGCEEFGHINYDIGKDPAAFGFPAARNLGDIVSSFAQANDARPGVGDIVEQIDHAACG